MIFFQIYFFLKIFLNTSFLLIKDLNLLELKPEYLLFIFY